MTTLLGFLARFGSFTTQSELLCTQGLAYLLQTYEHAAAALTEEVTKRTEVVTHNSLTWHAEVVHDQKERPDIEAQSENGVPFIMIEAKLGAGFGSGQLLAYLRLLQKYDEGEAAMLVLVPEKRIEEAVNAVSDAFGPPQADRWYLTDGRPCGIAVISWNEIFTSLRRCNEERFSYDLAQLEEMYKELRGDYIAPLANIEDLLHWRERETDFINVAKEVSCQLTPAGRLLPFQPEPLEEPSERPEGPSDEFEDQVYRRRYVRSPSDDSDSYFSIGVRDPFAGWKTPIWMRFHRATDKFGHIRQRIEKDTSMNKKDPSTKKKGWLESGGHIWIPMTVPFEVSGEQMIERIIEQAKEALRVAYQIE